MLVRSAFWIGRPRAGQEAAFRTLVDATLIPAMRRFPGVRDAMALWPVAREDDPPDIACQVLVLFDGPADLDRMRACPERAALRPRVAEAIALFDGRFSHIEYEAGTP